MPPLDHLRILDFTWALAGPFGTMILADMGADVCKVEPVGITEAERGPGPLVDGVNTYFFSINRGKHSVCIDLKKPEGRDLALALADQADVLTENFSPGTMASLGLGYAAVATRNPRIVYASTSGFGQTGPYAGRGAVDVIVQAMSGLMSITGHPEGPPARAGYSIADVAAGMFTAIGVLGALHERERSGKGQYLDVSMLDAQIALLENAFTRYFATGAEPQRIGTRHPLITPFQAFPTSDGYVVIAGVKDWTLFCALLDRDDLASDPRFETNELRTANHAEIEPQISDTLLHGTTASWIERLRDVCLIAPLNTIAEAAADPQVNARGMFVDLPADGNTLRVPASPLHYSRTPIHLGRGADTPAGSTAPILKEWLGMDDGEVARLAMDGVIQVAGDR
ncbi:MAG: CoA transferase [Chloroflexi bacterium]|nr:CoA transferase [Chloroflexota bacterium]